MAEDLLRSRFKVRTSVALSIDPPRKECRRRDMKTRQERHSIVKVKHNQTYPLLSELLV